MRGAVPRGGMMKKHDRQIQTAPGAGRADGKSRSTDKTKKLRGAQRRFFKYDSSALIEVFLNIAVMLVIVITAAGL